MLSTTEERGKADWDSDWDSIREPYMPFIEPEPRLANIWNSPVLEVI